VDLDLNLPLCSKDSICDIHLVIELAPIAFGINDYFIIHFDQPQCLTLSYNNLYLLYLFRYLLRLLAPMWWGFYCTLFALIIAYSLHWPLHRYSENHCIFNTLIKSRFMGFLFEKSSARICKSNGPDDAQHGCIALNNNFKGRNDEREADSRSRNL